uniref:Uncharacterized protein n=1 Tax=Rangifer tarandus platyrhynchus TaxID=3082113 RepID=A0ACB0FC90_RANTA|nr:unnamed protein product [Rangifer tarandus platyrhynchus]
MDTEEGPWRRRAEKQKQEQSCRPGERRRGCREVRDRRAGYARDKQGPSGSARGPWRPGGCGTGSRGAEETRWREEKNEGRVGHSFSPKGQRLSISSLLRRLPVLRGGRKEFRKKMSEQPPQPSSLLPVEASLARGGAQRRPLAQTHPCPPRPPRGAPHCARRSSQASPAASLPTQPSPTFSVSTDPRFSLVILETLRMPCCPPLLTSRALREPLKLGAARDLRCTFKAAHRGRS